MAPVSGPNLRPSLEFPMWLEKLLFADPGGLRKMHTGDWKYEISEDPRGRGVRLRIRYECGPGPLANKILEGSTFASRTTLAQAIGDGAEGVLIVQAEALLKRLGEKMIAAIIAVEFPPNPEPTVVAAKPVPRRRGCKRASGNLLYGRRG